MQKFNDYFEEKPNFQGVIASVSPVEYLELSDFLEKNSKDFKRIVILDGIEDPHNLGAIIRTTAAAGFDAVMVSNHRAAAITALVEKVSSGAVNHIPIIKTTSLSASIDILKKYLSDLGELDYKIKSGITNKNSALELFFINL